MPHTALSIFQARIGDRNDLAIQGAQAIGSMLASWFALEPEMLGTPMPALGKGWQEELELARPELKQIAAHFERQLSMGKRLLSASSRCAASLATLPTIARHRPDVCVVWFDAHADLHTPSTTTSGYLGGMALSGPAGLWDSGCGSGLALSNIIMVGQRDVDPAEQALIDREEIRHIAPGRAMVAELSKAIAGRPIYIHLDCDVLDPGIVPTEYRHDFGLSLHDLYDAGVMMAETEIVGLEIAEFQSAWAAGGTPVSPAPLLESLRPILRKLVAS
jgi:arginase